jgi:hypothetical protein
MPVGVLEEIGGELLRLRLDLLEPRRSGGSSSIHFRAWFLPTERIPLTFQETK